MQQAGYYQYPPAPPGAPNPYMQGYYYMQTPPPYELAGFGARFAAYFVDSIILGLITLPLAVYVELKIMDSMSDYTLPADQMFGSLLWLIIINGIVDFVVMILYFTLQEGGEKNATLGKRLLKIKVADIHGRQIGMREAFIRNLGRFTFIPVVSGIVLLVDVVLILSTDTQQRIGDRMAGTIVVKERVSFYNGPAYYPPPAQAYGPYAHPPYRPPPQEGPYRRK